MELTDQAKRDILNCVMEEVALISNKERQKKRWIQGEGPDFDETVCVFLHEGDGVLEKFKDFGITECQYRILKKFRDDFEAFADENDWPPAFIDTPEWTKITLMAKKVLEVFKYQSRDGNSVNEREP